jgi:NAD-dependent deacetylase
VVFFGEDLPSTQWRRAQRSAQRADVLISVGSSHLVQPANEIPLMAGLAGAKLITINTRPSDRINDSVFLLGPAKRVLPQLVAAAS